MSKLHKWGLSGLCSVCNIRRNGDKPPYIYSYEGTNIVRSTHTPYCPGRLFSELERHEQVHCFLSRNFDIINSALDKVDEKIKST